MCSAGAVHAVSLSMDELVATVVSVGHMGYTSERITLAGIIVVNQMDTVAL